MSKKSCKNCGAPVEIRHIMEGLIHTTGMYSCRDKNGIAEVQGMDGFDSAKSRKTE